MKTQRIFHRFLAVIFVASVIPALAQVTNLGIAPAGNQSVLYWPTTNANYILQSATNLAAPQWVTAGDALTVAAITVTNGLPQRFFRLLYTNAPTGMALIPAGSFIMGDALDGEADAHPTNIYVSGFYMDTNLVSFASWSAVYSYATGQGYGFVDTGSGKAANHPVQTVDWYDCVKWCNARSQQAGVTPVYYTDAGLTQVYKTGEVTPYVNPAANGYRLPTEAEWEKAARGGLNGRRFPWGNRIDENQANYYGYTSDSYDLGPNGLNAIYATGNYPYTSPVGSFDENGYGLYDMAGNLSEWCGDWYARLYGQPTTTNPTGPATGSNRVTRGGTWANFGDIAPCARRDQTGPTTANYYYGFRCVRGI